jgi:hypothetical protein
LPLRNAAARPLFYWRHIAVRFAGSASPTSDATTNWLSMFKNLPMSLLKLLAASLAVGILLSAFNVSAVVLLAELGVTPDDLWLFLEEAIDWAVPQLILGMLVVLPLWLIIYIFRPPQ